MAVKPEEYAARKVEDIAAEREGKRLQQIAATGEAIDSLTAYQPEPGTIAAELLRAGIEAQRQALRAQLHPGEKAPASATPEQTAAEPSAPAKKTTCGATPEQPRTLREFFTKASEEEFTKICNLLRDRYKQARRPIGVIKILRELKALGYDVQPSRQQINFARELSLLVTAGENPGAISRQVIADGLKKANDKGEALEIRALLK